MSRGAASMVLNDYFEPELHAAPVLAPDILRCPKGPVPTGDGNSASDRDKMSLILIDHLFFAKGGKRQWRL